MRSDELAHIFVARRDQYLLAGGGGARGEGADHIVRLDSLQAQQRQTERAHRIEQRFDLHAQVVGHRWAVRLVFGEQFVAERFARGIEDHHHRGGLVLAEELEQHVDHTEHRAGRLARRVGEGWQRVEGAV